MQVTMAVNDEHGNHSGMVFMLDFTPAGEWEIALALECEDGRPCKPDRKNKTVRIDGKVYPYLYYTTWAGNMALDSIEVTEQTARLIAENCRASGHWSCYVGYEHLFDAWWEDKPIMFTGGEG